MGIPKFSSWIKRNYGNSNFKNCPINIIDYFCIDFNGVLYPVIHQTLETYKVLPDCIDDILIDKIILKTSELIFMSGSDTVFIATDGVCPRAKMVQQRYRRFMSSMEEKKWDTSAITPGTAFMDKLNERMKERFGRDVILSDSTVPGEGEHKIIKFIENLCGKSIVIMGLDADLIVLSLKSSVKNRILIYKENTNNTSYIDISILSEMMLKDYGPNSLNDIVLLLNLLGNDFLPELKAVNDNGSMRCDKILEAYKKLNFKTPIVDKFLNINISHLKEIFTYLLILEKKEFPEYTHQKIYNEQKVYDLNNCLQEYYQGLSWIMNYYLDNRPCPSWTWHYRFRISPFLKDLIEFNPKPIKRWYKDEPLLSTHQLMLVLPIKSIELIPNDYLKELVRTDLKYFYPKNAVLDKEHSDMPSFHQKPFLPDFDEDYIKNLVSIMSL